MPSEPTAAWGQVKLDLVEGTVAAGLARADAPMDLWLVQNVPGEGRSIRPEPGDRVEHIGTLTPTRGVARLHARFPLDMKVDLAVMTPANVRPEEDPHLVGYTTLFHHLHDQGRTTPLEVAEEAVSGLFPFSTATAAATTGHASLEKLIKTGERLFTNETFKGNGRTCASCHPVLHNFTIDPEFVASRDPLDPLLIAEFDPALAELEDPALMRELALIRENPDGLDDLEDKFTMRGVPHTLALPTSIDVFFFDEDDTTTDLEALGWGGDGSTNGAAPSLRALRDFTNGAIVQHFPRTLARVDGADFRLATEYELEALEAFQLSLGRQEELDLAGMSFLDAEVAAGSQLFNTHKCVFCHANAGANDLGIHPFGGRLAGGNLNLNTGVENIPLDTHSGERPRDGGFGRQFDIATPLNPVFDQDGDGVVDELFSGPLLFDCAAFPHTSEAFGDGAFNIPSLVEAADTPPFFHNNAVNDLEDAVAFYGTAPFNCSPGGRAVGQIVFEDGDVGQITAFLRALNALENIRASDDHLFDAKAANGLPAARARLDAALADAEDAVQVLEASALHPDDAVKALNNAILYTRGARRLSDPTLRSALVGKAQIELRRAKAFIGG